MFRLLAPALIALCLAPPAARGDAKADADAAYARMCDLYYGYEDDTDPNNPGWVEGANQKYSDYANQVIDDQGWYNSLDAWFAKVTGNMTVDDRAQVAACLSIVYDDLLAPNPAPPGPLLTWSASAAMGTNTTGAGQQMNAGSAFWTAGDAYYAAGDYVSAEAAYENAAAAYTTGVNPYFTQVNAMCGLSETYLGIANRVLLKYPPPGGG